MNQTIRKLINKKIKLEGVSDIICLSSNGWRDTYKNVRTKKESTIIENLIEKDRKHIVFPTRKRYGFYATHNKENDALIILSMEYDLDLDEWEEICRVIITRTEAPTGRFAFQDSIDITGDYYNNQNIPGKSTQVIRDYFGGFARTRTKNIIGEIVWTFYSGYEINELVKERNNNIYTGIAEYGAKNKINVDWSVPNEFKNRIGMLMKTLLFNKNNKVITAINGFIKCGYLQNTQYGYVFRLFTCYAKGNLPSDKNSHIDIAICEFSRIWIDNVQLDDKKNSAYNLLRYPVIFYDKEGIDEGMFKYTKHILQNMVNYAKKICSGKVLDIRSNNILWHKCNMYFLFSITKNPLYEKLFNCPYEKLRECFKEVFFVNDATKKWAEDLFHGINWDKKSLHQMLGIPSSMLKCIGTEKGVYAPSTFIAEIKFIFGVHSDYLANMNSAQAVRIVHLIKSFSYDTYMPSQIKRTLNALVDIYGPSNIENYINYVYKYHLRDNEYYAYIQRLHEIGDYAKDVSWKLKGKELKRAYNSLETVYYLQLDKTKYKECAEKFDALGEKWKQYEYEEGNFIITYPKKPSDIILEGIKLHHCVKEFVDHVANDGTMILFIRKKKNIDKPFYTLEIKNNRIRQCHGVNNSNVPQNSDLQKIIKKFCKEKNIVYAKGEKLLGME